MARFNFNQPADEDQSELLINQQPLQIVFSCAAQLSIIHSTKLIIITFHTPVIFIIILLTGHSQPPPLLFRLKGCPLLALSTPSVIGKFNSKVLGKCSSFTHSFARLIRRHKLKRKTGGGPRIIIIICCHCADNSIS